MKRNKASVFSGLLASVFLIGEPAQAQTLSVDQLREETHLRLKAGHVALAYSQTDEAMAEIHADRNQSDALILFYTGRSQAISDWVNGNAQDG